MTINAKETPPTTIWLNRQMVWATTADPEFPYAARLGSQQCLIRLNDFPNQQLYTLLVNGEAVAEFDDWPTLWSRGDKAQKEHPQAVLDYAIQSLNAEQKAA